MSDREFDNSTMVTVGQAVTDRLNHLRRTDSLPQYETPRVFLLANFELLMNAVTSGSQTSDERAELDSMLNVCALSWNCLVEYAKQNDGRICGLNLADARNQSLAKERLKILTQIGVEE